MTVSGCGSIKWSTSQPWGGLRFFNFTFHTLSPPCSSTILAAWWWWDPNLGWHVLRHTRSTRSSVDWQVLVHRFPHDLDNVTLFKDVCPLITVDGRGPLFPPLVWIQAHCLSCHSQPSANEKHDDLGSPSVGTTTRISCFDTSDTPSHPNFSEEIIFAHDQPILWEIIIYLIMMVTHAFSLSCQMIMICSLRIILIIQHYLNLGIMLYSNRTTRLMRDHWNTIRLSRLGWITPTQESRMQATPMPHSPH